LSARNEEKSGGGLGKPKFSRLGPEMGVFSRKSINWNLFSDSKKNYEYG